MGILLTFIITAILAAILELLILRTKTGERMLISLFRGKKQYYKVSEEYPFEKYGKPYKYAFETRKIVFLFLLVGIIFPLVAYLIGGLTGQVIVSGVLIGTFYTILYKIDMIETFTRHEKKETKSS